MVSILALSPIVVILVLMLGPGWPAWRAGVAGLVMGLVVAIATFSFPAGLGDSLTMAQALGGVGAEAGFTALTILWIIGPALGIHELQVRTGATETIRSALGAIAPDPQILALLIAWFFALFMEGAAGFGSSVALAAPFLVAVGFGPVEAVTAALIGHSVGVSFGAIGTPVVPQVAASGLSGLEIARATGIYHSLLGWIPLLAMLAIARRGSPEGVHTRPAWRWAAVAFLCFVIPYTLLWAFVGPELPTLGGSLFGGLLFVLALRVFGRRGSGPGSPDVAAPPATSVTAGAVLRAAAPYLVIILLVLLTRLVPPARAAAQSLEIVWSVSDVFSGSMLPLYHPGTVLLLGFIAGAMLQRAGAATVRAAVWDATRRILPVAVALSAMLLLARIMVHAGMTQTLAAAAADAAGSAWPPFAPFVGLLGTFVTGSATASNILFSDFQRETALAAGLSIAGVLGIHGFGAAVGNIVCPHNVVAAGATVGLAGEEGKILRRTMWVALVYTAAGGAVSIWVVG